MRNQFGKTAGACTLSIVCLASAASTQTAAPAAQAAPAAPVSIVVAMPRTAQANHMRMGFIGARRVRVIVVSQRR